MTKKNDTQNFKIDLNGIFVDYSTSFKAIKILTLSKMLNGCEAESAQYFTGSTSCRSLTESFCLDQRSSPSNPVQSIV